MPAAQSLTLTPAPADASSTDPRQRAAVSVVIPTLNESARIAAAVADLAWADEVIVIDGGSSDTTATLARAAGAHVLVLTESTIGGQRNAGIAAARNHWILALDADERVTPQLRAEVSTIVNGSGAAHAAYRMKFRNHYLGQELRHGPWGRDWHVRLFTSDRRYDANRVHESLERIDDVGTLAGPILHQPYRDVAHHVAKIVKYAKWGAEDMQARGRRAGLRELAMRPAWRFVRDYVVYSGWRDGTVGFIAAALSAFASFLKYAFLFAKPQSADS
jgi:glycosyltransferase involved in cell wall biosynthesis